MRHIFNQMIATGLLFLTLIAPSASASFHLWKIDEVFSDISGKVQFIDLFTNADGQNLLNSSNPPLGQAISSTSAVFNFPVDLPSASTGNHHFLIGTPGYAALPNVPRPDYVLTSNNFFDPINDMLNYANVSSIVFMEELLPTDGKNALFRPFSASDNAFEIRRNLAINFAGQSGSVSAAAVPLPPGMGLGLAMLGLLLIGRKKWFQFCGASGRIFE